MHDEGTGTQTSKPANQRAHNHMMISHHDASPRAWAQGVSIPFQELQICCLQTPGWPGSFDLVRGWMRPSRWPLSCPDFWAAGQQQQGAVLWRPLLQPAIATTITRRAGLNASGKLTQQTICSFQASACPGEGAHAGPCAAGPGAAGRLVECSGVRCQ